MHDAVAAAALPHPHQPLAGQHVAQPAPAAAPAAPAVAAVPAAAAARARALLSRLAPRSVQQVGQI